MEKPKENRAARRRAEPRWRYPNSFGPIEPDPREYKHEQKCYFIWRSCQRCESWVVATILEEAQRCTLDHDPWSTWAYEDLREHAYNNATRYNLISLLQYLYEAGARPKLENLSWAVSQKDAVLLKTLIDHGGDLDEQRPQRGTLLCDAAVCEPLLDLFLAHGADPNGGFVAADGTLLSRSGLTPLGQAARQGNLRMVRSLLDAGASATLGTPLIYAASQYAIFEALIDAGADVNQHERDHVPQAWSNGRVLHNLVFADEPEQMIELLLRHGADPAGWNQRGLTPLDFAEFIAKEKGTVVSESIVRLLQGKRGRGPWSYERSLRYYLLGFVPISGDDEEQEGGDRGLLQRFRSRCEWVGVWFGIRERFLREKCRHWKVWWTRVAKGALRKQGAQYEQIKDQ